MAMANFNSEQNEVKINLLRHLSKVIRRTGDCWWDLGLPLQPRIKTPNSPMNKCRVSKTRKM